MPKSHPLLSPRIRVSSPVHQVPLPEWDSSCSDLHRYRLTAESQIKRKLATISKNNSLCVVELRRKLGDVKGAFKFPLFNVS